MALGQNVNLSDKLIKNTTDKTNKRNKANTTNKGIIARKASNTNITGIGQPSTNPDTATYSTKKMTFYVKDDLLKKLYNFAYWDRHTITEALNLVLADGLKGKNTKDKE